MTPEMKRPASAATLSGAESDSGQGSRAHCIAGLSPWASRFVARHPDALARRRLFLDCREIADACARRGFPIKWARPRCEIHAVNHRDRGRVSWLEAVEIARAAWQAAAAEHRRKSA
jgi:hypothetical protein